MPRLINNYDPFFYQSTINNNKVLVEDINGKANPKLNYQCPSVELESVDILSNQDMLLKSILNSGMKEFTKAFHPTHAYIIGTGGVSFEDFLKTDIENWL